MSKKQIKGLEVYLDEDLGTHILEFNDVQGITGKFIISDDFEPVLIPLQYNLPLNPLNTKS
jgi:hypothetical protein